MVGDHFAVYEDEKSARAAGEERAKRALMKQRQATQRVSLENLFGYRSYFNYRLSLFS